MSLLEVKNLRVEFPTRRGTLVAIDDVSFSIAPGEVLGMVGESGAGKSLTGASIIGLLEPPGHIAGGEIWLEGRRIDQLPYEEIRKLRGNRIGAIFQDPLTSLNPRWRVHDVIAEPIRVFQLMKDDKEILARVGELLTQVGLSPADGAKFPHEFSGGQRQRFSIARTLASKPEFLVCDEHLKSALERLGFFVEYHDAGQSHHAPLVLARRAHNPTAPTLLIYGHYDVQPIDPVSEWTDPPFQPTVHGNFLFGRGTADDKGQFFAHIKAIEILDRLGLKDLPNLTLVLDSQEEAGSPRLAEIVTANREVHSGVYGGVLRNAATELVAFLSTLVDEHGVVPPSDADRQAMADIPFDPEQFFEDMGPQRHFGLPELSHWEKLMFRPVINIAGLSSGYQGAGAKTIIPREATAKIDLRIVKNQTPEGVLDLLREHADANGMPDLDIKVEMKYHPARSGANTAFSQMVKQAVEMRFPKPPVTVPVVRGSNPNYIWTDILGLPVVEATYAQADPRVRAPDERFALSNFRCGILTSALVLLGTARLT